MYCRKDKPRDVGDMIGIRNLLKTHNRNNSDQLRWVILLLSVAVILPTVCLLWFMTQAVKNERLAVRQKIIDVCNDEIATFKADVNRNFAAAKSSDLKRIESLIDNSDIWLWINAIKGDADGLVIYDANNKLVYPVISEYQSSDFTSEIQKAFNLEQNGDYQKALDEYQIIMDANDDDIFAASMGVIRCLEKSGQVVEAADFFHKLLWSDNRSIRKQFTPNQVAMIRVKQVQWLAEHKGTFTDGGMFTDLDLWYTKTENYPAEVTIWALEKIIKIAREYSEDYKLEKPIENAEKIIDIEKISLACATFFNDSETLRNWPMQKWKTIKTPHVFYVIRYAAGGHDVLLARTGENILSTFVTDIKNIAIADIGIRLLDDTDKLLLGVDETKNKPFITTDFSRHLPDWKLELYFESDSVFDNAASKQTAIYTWTGVLVALLILASGAIAAQAISRQAKLNRLKNDFIATVTHELKTPLSSMRVLADTLLEGNYNDQQQATEYLQLISKENARLSRLIDNFLTFSRMERNKQAFDFVKNDPAEIAKNAAEAVQTKFNNGNCEFSVTINNNLPSIMADKDAMVTVLVNLLDNAYKYSYDNKQIELKVFAQEAGICFSVKDKGIGMTRRQIKRVFDRFYQADSSLSRQAEGTGLGLSIVKFIIDAHKGQITIDSKPDKGSEFTIIL